MKRILNLALAMLVALAFCSANAEDHQHPAHSMTMHHMHVLINHAVGMATEGSNLIMLGEMNMAGSVDDLTVKHGKMMIEHAKSLINEVMNSDAMAAMHKEGSTMVASKEMAYTHKLAQAATDYINMLSDMPSAGK